MLSDRQRRIISLLETRDYSVAELAEKIGMSARTINREISEINQKLEDTATIIINDRCSLQIKDEICFFKLLNEGVPERMFVLFDVLVNENINLDELADKIFVSKQKIRKYLNDLNDEFKHTFQLEIKPGTGIIFRSASISIFDLLSDLLLNYPDLMIVSRDSKNNTDQKLVTSSDHLTESQIKAQQRAAQLLNEEFSPKNELIDQLNESFNHIQDLIINIFNSNGYPSPPEKVIKMLYQHIVREAEFPVVIMKNKQEIKAYLEKDPVAFDLAKKLTIELKKEYPSLHVNVYYIALYMMLALNTYDESMYKFILLSRHPSISSINKYRIEESIKSSSVSVVSQAHNLELNSNDFVTIVDSDVLTNDVLETTPDIVINGLISSLNIQKIQKIARRKFFKPLLSNVSDYKLNNISTDFMDAFQKFCNLLQEISEISELEKDSLINRENAGNQLVIDNYSIPHIISSTNKNFRLYQAVLATPVLIHNQFVDHILVVIIGVNVANKSEIFKFLFDEISAK